MGNKQRFIHIEGVDIKISNPDKILFQDVNLSKWEYVMAVSRLAPYLLPYCKNRLLTTVRFPDGPNGTSFFQKNVSKHRPEWIESYKVKNTEYIVLNNIKTLVWLINLACIEFHTSFNTIFKEDYPTELVFDIDPSVSDFSKVIEVALETKAVLEHLDLTCFVKTSGASGLQIYVSIKPKYTYEETRIVTEFIASYLAKKRPDIVTLERKVKRRDDKVYFDYLQHGRNKTLIAAYSPRGTKEATVSCPLQWEELSNPQLHPTQFTLFSIFDRLEKMGDLFEPLQQQADRACLDALISFIKRHSKQ